MNIKLSDYSTEMLNSESPWYTISVSYYALGWFDLLNSFKLGIPVYILVFSIVSIVILGIVGLIYLLHLLLFRN